MPIVDIEVLEDADVVLALDTSELFADVSAKHGTGVTPNRFLNDVLAPGIATEETERQSEQDPDIMDRVRALLPTGAVRFEASRIFWSA